MILLRTILPNYVKISKNYPLNVKTLQLTLLKETHVSIALQQLSREETRKTFIQISSAASSEV